MYIHICIYFYDLLLYVHICIYFQNRGSGECAFCTPLYTFSVLTYALTGRKKQMTRLNSLHPSLEACKNKEQTKNQKTKKNKQKKQKNKPYVTGTLAQ